MIFLVVSSALLMSAIDQTIVATGLPSIQRELSARVNWGAWIITAYSFGQIIAMPLAGRVSDQIGRKTIFLGAMVLFIFSSLICGLSANIYTMVAFRGLQGLGGGAFMPSATGLISDVFGTDRDRAVGLFASILPIGGVIGPLLGGILITYVSWRAIFLVNIPLGLLIILTARRRIPPSVPRPAERADLVGLGLLGGALLGGMLTLGILGEPHASLLDWRALASATLVVVAASISVRRNRRYAPAVLPLRLLSGRAFRTMHLINLLYGAATLGFGALVPLYAELRYHVSPLKAGSLLMARAIGMVSLAGVAVLLLRKTGHRAPMLLGFCVIAIGQLLMARAPWRLSSYHWLAMAAGITGLGMGVAVPASNNATLHLAERDIASVAGLRGMFRQTGAIAGIAATTSILSRANDPGLTQARVFIAFGALLVMSLPLVLLVPDHRGSW